MNKPHMHAEQIKAWADGAVIEVFGPEIEQWIIIDDPAWYENLEYRIKPELPEIPWHVIKAEFKFAAMDADGEWYAHTERPMQHASPISAPGWRSLGDRCADLYLLNIPEYKGDWRDSLIERPEGV